MAGGEKLLRRRGRLCPALCLALLCAFPPWAFSLADAAPQAARQAEHGLPPLLLWAAVENAPEPPAADIALHTEPQGAPAPPPAETDGAATAGKSGEARPESTGGKVHLFGTIEFRSVLKNTPQWERVVAEERKKSGLDHPVGLAADWKTTRTALRGKPLLEQLNVVNRFFNRYPYRLDVEIYGIRNYWATPAEFMKNSGDCKDYSIIKYYALKQLGVDPDSMRIVVLTDVIRNLAHAVVAVYHEGNAYILDSLSNLVLPHTRLTHYKPQFSVNENYRWAHMAPKKNESASTRE